MWLIAALAIGVLYAFFIYRPHLRMGHAVGWVLFSIRALVVGIICFLLFGPLLHGLSKKIEKPIVAIVVDNSQSLLLGRDRAFNKTQFPLQIKALAKTLSDHYEVRSFSFGDHFREGFSFDYKDKATDFSQAISDLADRFGGKNLGAVVIASDGIFNRGALPAGTLKELQAPIYTIALGDTASIKDISIASVNANDVVYEGDKFSFQATLKVQGYKGAHIEVDVLTGHKVLQKRSVAIQEENAAVEVPFILDAGSPGFRAYEAIAKPMADETNVLNNAASRYIEVIKGKQKILLIYGALNPDVATLSSAISSLKNNAVTLQSEEKEVKDLNGYNLVIVYQPVGNLAGWVKNLNEIEKRKIPVWYFTGVQTNGALLNAIQKNLVVTLFNGQVRESAVAVDRSFKAFLLADHFINSVSRYPPLQVPFGAFQFKRPFVPLLQTASSQASGQPLLVLSLPDEGARWAYFFGEGLWRFHLIDFDTASQRHAVDEVIDKVVQYLADKNDARRFKVTTEKRVYHEDEPIAFNAQLYNDAYELVNEPDVKMTLKNQQGKSFTYLFSKTDGQYSLQVGAMPQGLYDYTASVKYNGHAFTQSGPIAVLRTELENEQQTADSHLLYQLSSGSGGVMVYPNAMNTLADKIKNNEEVRPLIHQEDQISQAIENPLFFILITLLIALEWIVRKWNGFY